MKKLAVCLYIIICFSFLASGCNIDMTKVAYNKKKPFNFYYTNELAKGIKLEPSYKAVLFETNFFKQKELSKDDKSTILNFLNELKKADFIEKPSNLPSKPLYKLSVSFSKSKYVINIYNDKYASVYPWDGEWEMDYIDMTNIHVSNNLLYLCSFNIPRQH